MDRLRSIRQRLQDVKLVRKPAARSHPHQVLSFVNEHGRRSPEAEGSLRGMVVL
jgi:hypothetical protein